MSTESWAIVASIVVAISGYVFTYFHKRSVDRRAARLKRVNLQLRNLYGPLFATLVANNAVWKAFVKNHWPKHGNPGFFTGGELTTDEEKKTWRIWMLSVFEPINARTEKIILSNGDLIEGDELPQVFADMLAHIAAYRATYERWKQNDFSEHTSVFNYPDGLLGHVDKIYRSLRQLQRQLIAETTKQGVEDSSSVTSATRAQR